MTDLNDKDQKTVIKQAIKEWMDERYADVGRWTIRSLIVAGVTMFLFKYIEWRGFRFP